MWWDGGLSDILVFITKHRLAEGVFKIKFYGRKFGTKSNFILKKYFALILNEQ